jgi:hypothetical protein
VPCVARLIFFLFEPRATPAARFAFGAAFFLAARFNFFLSGFSTLLVFILSSFRLS